MLVITLPDQEFFDDQNDVFVVVPGRTVKLEYSLLALSKWESIHQKPFLPNGRENQPEHSKQELFSFLECMVIGEISPRHLIVLFNRFDTEISEYIQSSSSATNITYHSKSKGASSFITSELIYYWIFNFQIDKSCEQWHLNRLLKLIEIFVVKQNPKTEKLSTQEVMARNRALKAKRDAEWGLK